jgi:hypothetical protein
MLCVAALTLCMAGMAFGQIATTDSHGRPITVTTPKSSTPRVIRGSGIEPETITIYNNVGSGYNGSSGFTESGIDSSVGAWYAQVMAFTPTKTHYLAEVEVAMGYVNGTEGFALHVETDKSGLPSNKSLYSCKITSMYGFGSSSTDLDTCKVPKAKKIALKAKTQYWVVVLVNSDEWAAWNFNATGATGPVAISEDDGKTWTSEGTGSNGAFIILGK